MRGLRWIAGIDRTGKIESTDARGQHFEEEFRFRAEGISTGKQNLGEKAHPFRIGRVA